MTTRSQIALGVDGGGTKTEAVLLDANCRLLGRGLGGPSSFDKTGLEAATANIGEAIAAARAAAQLPEGPFDAAFFGMAGVTSEQDRETVRGICRALNVAPPAQIGVDHDLRAALAGGLSGRPGIVVIAGTGSSTYGTNAAGQSWKSGGYGTMISDDGSSYWFGVRAIRAAAMIADGRLPRSSAALLYEPVMRQLGIAGVDDIMHRLHVTGISPAEVAAFAPVLLEAARQGDAYALAAIQEGMSELARCVGAVARELGMAGGGCELALVGGVFRNGELVIGPLRDAVQLHVPGCEPRLAELSPAIGAALLALRGLAVTITYEMLAALRA